MQGKRVLFFDELKALAILSVVVFHLGYFKWGYLGVDVFLVIAGYLTMKGVWRSLDAEGFSVVGFIGKRLVRLLPLALLACAISLSIGLFVMLPDDLENLSQAVIATSFFANNILCRISSGDYWAQNNDFKPLLHFWYLGVLMQLYVGMALMAVFSLGRKRILYWLLIVCGAISAALWFLKIGSQPVRFYYMPWRFWEFALGCLLFVWLPPVTERLSLKLFGLAAIGRASLSIYVWHYVLLAFWRYAVSPHLSGWEVFAYFLSLSVVAGFSYRYLEQSSTLSRLTFGRFACLVVPIFMLLNVWAFMLYRCSGVIRDIPELDIVKGEAVVGMHNHYNDRVRKMVQPFPRNGKINVLVIGNSFGRDWANVLLESSYADKINLLYTTQDASAIDLETYLPQADIIFVTGFYPDRLPAELRDGNHVKVSGRMNVWVVGDKWFGVSNGVFYNRRHMDGYSTQTLRLPESFEAHLERECQIYKDRYVDIMAAISVSPGIIPIFSDEGKFLSQDCKHLTQGGARFVAKKVDLDRCFSTVIKGAVK